MPKITIIETGVISPANRARHGSFPQMFERLLGEADPSASFATVRLADGEALPDPAGLEAILLTGSPAGVYDDLDWIAPLERFVRAAYDAKIPMAGICFGHQLIAQALGGTVRKSEKGWGIGRHVYDVVPGNGVIDGEKNRDSRLASGPGHRAAHGGNDDIPFGVHAARGTSLCERRDAVGAAASRIHHGLCAYLLRKSRPEQRSRTVGRDGQGFARSAPRQRRPRPRHRALSGKAAHSVIDFVRCRCSA